MNEPNKLDHPGVIAAVPMTGIGAASGIAVVADTWWRAKTALEAMPVEWEPGPNGNKSTSDLINEYRARLDHRTLPKGTGMGFAIDDRKSMLTTMRFIGPQNVTAVSRE